jgi:hypothetical protein
MGGPHISDRDLDDLRTLASDGYTASTAERKLRLRLA